MTATNWHKLEAWWTKYSDLYQVVQYGKTGKVYSTLAITLRSPVNLVLHRLYTVEPRYFEVPREMENSGASK